MPTKEDRHDHSQSVIPTEPDQYPIVLLGLIELIGSAVGTLVGALPLGCMLQKKSRLSMIIEQIMHVLETFLINIEEQFCVTRFI